MGQKDSYVGLVLGDISYSVIYVDTAETRRSQSAVSLL